MRTPEAISCATRVTRSDSDGTTYQLNDRQGIGTFSSNLGIRIIWVIYWIRLKTATVQQGVHLVPNRSN